MLLRLEVLDLAGEFWDSGSLLSSDALAEHVILLLNVKAVTIHHIKDQLLQLYPYLRLYYFLRFDSSVNKQISTLIARSVNGVTAVYPLVQNMHQQGILMQTVVPAPNAPSALAITATRTVSDKLETIAVERHPDVTPVLRAITAVGAAPVGGTRTIQDIMT
ncbi:hypothetical protein BGZ97_009130, partial [Linnemannia gamsii]